MNPYTWRFGNTEYELFPDHNTEIVRITAANPGDRRPREFFFPKKLLTLYVRSELQRLASHLVRTFLEGE